MVDRMSREKRSNQIAVRLTDAELAVLSREAAKEGVSLSDVIRIAVHRHYKDSFARAEVGNATKA